ncbi:uncharacterized protein [Littorina saxatilis]|uniref:Uncharacterized protein n=1 Tax=Littorina saxatilis TaxID=31220 RepID=A0AAN9AJR9_9CAEN
MAAVVELVWLVVMVVSAILATRISTQKWLIADAVLAFLFAACTIPFAVKSQQMQTSGIPIDAAHGYLCNVYICYCLMPAIAFLLLKDSKDPTCTTALLLSRTVGAGLATLIITFGHFYAGIFNPMHLYYGVFGNAAWAGVSGFHLYLGGKANRRGVASKVDLFLQVDIAFALCYAIPDLLIPDVILSLCGMKADALHTHLLQVGGGVHVGTAALSFMALRFTSPNHKKAVLMSRIAIMLLMWAVRTYSWVALEPATSFYSYFMACTGYLPFFPAYLGIRQAY